MLHSRVSRSKGRHPPAFPSRNNSLRIEFEAKLRHATLGPVGELGLMHDTLTPEICLHALKYGMPFPPRGVIANMGFSRALLYYATISIQDEFVGSQNRDVRWSTAAKILEAVGAAVNDGERCLDCNITDVGSFSRNPRTTLEYLFRDVKTSQYAPESDEAAQIVLL